MKLITTTCALLLALTGSVAAQTDDATPGRDLAERIYGSIEDNPSADADMGEFINFGSDIFVSMDYDESNSVEFSEFSNWDFGFNFIADDKGNQRAYEAAQKIIFAIWDQDADGKISLTEYNKSMVRDFRRADLNDDAFLTREEFMSGYIVILAYRAAVGGK